MKYLRLLAILIVMVRTVPAHAMEVTDVLGDATIGTVQGPDIVSMEGTHDTNNYYLSVRFAPLTMSTSTLGTIIGLNTDLNATTGCCSTPTFFPIGAEYSLNWTATALTEPGKFKVSEWVTPSSTTVLGYLTPTFVSNGYDLTVPFSLFGFGISGPAQFGLVAGLAVEDRQFSPYDFLVDQGPIVHGPTSPVPVPAAVWLFASGLASLGGVARWRPKRRLA